MNTARFIRQLNDWKTDARFYELSHPITCEFYDDETNEYIETETNFVIVSATIAMFSGAETYIFPANKNGNTLCMLELPGSFRGGLDHKQALDNAGYIIE